MLQGFIFQKSPRMMCEERVSVGAQQMQDTSQKCKYNGIFSNTDVYFLVRHPSNQFA